jgi:hypothetical protein
MAWETRLGKYRYFVVSRRQDGRVVHLSFKGPAGEIAAWEAMRRRENRQKAVAARREYRALWAQARAPLEELIRLTKLLQVVVLLAAGYHQHARGQWRRRAKPMPAQAPPAPTPAAPTAPAHTPSGQPGNLWQHVKALADRAQKGDAAALPEIRRFLDEHPEVWKTVGDWGVHAREAWVKLSSRGDAVIAESSRRRLDALKAELSEPFQKPLERLLVERLVICVFQLELADAELAGAEKLPAAQRGDVRKCHEAAQRAFDQAQKALTRHRQLIKAGPSPIDLLNPVAERSPAGKDRSAPRRAAGAAGAGVG